MKTNQIIVPRLIPGFCFFRSVLFSRTLCPSCVVRAGFWLRSSLIPSCSTKGNDGNNNKDTLGHFHVCIAERFETLSFSHAIAHKAFERILSSDLRQFLFLGLAFLRRFLFLQDFLFFFDRFNRLLIVSIFKWSCNAPSSFRNP